MFLAKKWGILIKKESESLEFTGLKIPRDHWEDWEDEKKDVCSAQSDIECMEAVVNISKMVEEIKDASYVIGEGEPDATEVIRTDRALKIIKEKLGI